MSLDVGTDNETLLNDPLYLGNRHARVRGAAYDAFIGTYLETVSALFPNALLHFEDFGPGNARLILTEYRDKYRNFNDDMQGTGAITQAALLAAVRWGAEQTGYPFTTAASKFAAQASLDAMVAAAAGPRGLAVPLMKIANDIRRLASGPRCGLVTWP